MEVATVMLVLIVLFFVGIVLLGFFHPKSGAEVLRWQATRGPEQEEIDELEDLAQLLEATNAKRRARGEPERTVEDLENELRGG
ncbi:hypothetical protein LRS13_20885 [Svornostia abyssi]|uniref:Uncharacterized protein n=1 Tax=Svornostia abyssi TaxID=2898438 RepID=A0ABY5PEL4_9ACTN|nr:hypothetical protein LRS13_20885 [Parviterribacteraceae bacterium J379]